MSYYYYYSSWGGGCMPLLHSLAIGESRTVRSYDDKPDDTISKLLGDHKKKATHCMAAKVRLMYILKNTSILFLIL